MITTTMHLNGSRQATGGRDLDRGLLSTIYDYTIGRLDWTPGHELGW